MQWALCYIILHLLVKSTSCCCLMSLPMLLSLLSLALHAWGTGIWPSLYTLVLGMNSFSRMCQMCPNMWNSDWACEPPLAYSSIHFTSKESVTTSILGKLFTLDLSIKFRPIFPFFSNVHPRTFCSYPLQLALYILRLISFIQFTICKRNAATHLSVSLWWETKWLMPKSLSLSLSQWLSTIHPLQYPNAHSRYPYITFFRIQFLMGWRNVYIISICALWYLGNTKCKEIYFWKNHMVAFGHVVVINDKSLVLSRWKSIDELQEMVHYAEKVYSAPFSNVFSWKLSLWRNNQFSWVGSLFLMIPSSVGQTWKYFLHWCLSISPNSFQPLVPCLINLFFNVS